MIDLTGSEEDRIANLIVKTMREIYEVPMVPSMLANGYPTPDEWKFAFRLMQQYLRLSTSAAVPRPRTPPDTPQEVFVEMKELLKNNLPGSFPHWNGNVADFLKALFSWFGKGLALLVMLATLPGAVLMRFMMLAPRWIIYLFNLSIYYIVSAIRTMLCFTGWGYCSKEDFTNFGFLNSWISTPPFEFNTYPAKTLPNLKPPFYWLIPPEWINNREAESTVPIPKPKRGLRPEWMMDPANIMDENAVQAFIAASTPHDTRQLETRNSFSFGNAVEFSIALLEGRFGNPVPDFDLDGDRGFGYHGWEELPPSELYV
ncbi:hypothetical protein [Agrobacterium sp. P15N1-A]|uniref:hypothetical protein n=1 Tax=Agrobacterium sp. P15N1-A TaxID=3342820 RepID=UPI0037D1D84E